MSIYELIDRSASGTQYSVSWLIPSAATADSALSQLIAGVPATITYNGNVLPLLESACSVEEQQETKDLYKGKAVYELNSAEAVKEQVNGALDAPTPGTNDVYTFSIGGGTVHRQYAEDVSPNGYVSAAYAAPFGAIPAVGLAICASDDGTVKGIDVPAGHFTFTLKRRFIAGTMSQTEVNAINDLVGKTNSATFKGYAAGEVLFNGCQSSEFALDGSVDITYQFSVQKSETLKVRNTAGADWTITKTGWDYVDLHFAGKAADGILLHLPSAYRVLRVFPRASFTPLGLT